MVMYVGGEHTAAVVGRRTEAVTCEKCRTAYRYELRRVGSGKASSPFFLFRGWAADRAEAAAKKDLAGRLGNDAELVPCPKCHWVNESLVARYRARLYRRVPLVAVIVVVAGIVLGPLVATGLTAAFGYNSQVPRVAVAVVLGACLTSPAWLLLGRRWLRRRVDPNRSYPRRPDVPPGTPPALVQRRNPTTGATQYVTVPSEPDDADRFAGWAVLRPGQVKLPNVCCACLDDAETWYDPPFKVDQGSTLDVPLCWACAARLRTRWWAVAAGVAAVALVGAWLLVGAVPGIDQLGRHILFGVAGLFGVLFGVAIVPNAVTRPYRLAVVDADRGVVKFAARNRGYTELVIGHARRADSAAATTVRVDHLPRR